MGWGVIFTITVLPLLYFPGRVSSYTTSKEFFFIGMVDLLFCLWVWVMLRNTNYRLSKKNLFVFIPLFLFLLSATISSVIGVNPLVSFFSTVESGTGMILLWHALFFTVILASIIRARGEQFLKKVFQGILLASVTLAIMTWFTNLSLWDVHSKMLDGSIGGGTMGNVLLAAAYFIFSIFFALILIIKESLIKKRFSTGSE